MELPTVLSKLFKYIDENKTKYIQNLKEAVAIRSISSLEANRDETCKMVHWTANRLRNLGVQVTLKDIGIQMLPNGNKIPLPPALLGILGTDPNKKTVCVYAHLDVQPAVENEGWDSDPFQLQERDGKLYGRGACDDKGPVLSWIHAIEAFQAINESLPVNLKILFEAMEETGSNGLKELIISEKHVFFKDVNYICICDGSWLNKTTPCIGYGLKGFCYFHLTVECASQDLHSGMHGGGLHEAMTELIYLLSTLVDKEGKILVTDFYKNVAAVDAEEKKLYSNIDFDIEDYKKSINATKIVSEDKVTFLLRLWRYPCLSIHGIEGAHSEPGEKSVIPSKVTGKFSIRIVENQTVDEVKNLVINYLHKKWEERGNLAKIKVSMMISGPPWKENSNHPHYFAAKRAVRHAYNIEPDLVRSGGSISVITDMQQTTGKSIVNLMLSAGDDNAHSQNEKINVENYIKGTKLVGAYLYELAQLEI